MRSHEYTNEIDPDFIGRPASDPHPDFIARRPERKDSEVSRAVAEVEQLISKVSELPLNKRSAVLAHLREARALLSREAEF
jgi:hypothetical protein